MTSKERNTIMKKFSSFRSTDKDRVKKYIEKDSVVKELAIDENFVTKLQQILLQKPSINKVERIITTSPGIGDHHSKNFVADICSRLKKHKEISEYIVDVYHCKYNSNKRGYIIVSKGKDDYWSLKVYDRKDEGYGAEIRLRCEKIYEAVLIAKYISERVSCFKKFDIKIDEKYKVQAQ